MAVAEVTTDATTTEDAAALAAAVPAEDSAEAHDALFAEFASKKHEDAPALVADADDAEKTEPAETVAAAPAAAATTTDAAAKAAPAEDIWKSATPEQRAAWDAAQQEAHALKSNAGRTPTLDREVSRLRAENAALRAGKAAPGDNAPQRLSALPEVKKMLEDLPEVSPLAAQLERLAQNQDDIGRAVKDITDSRHTDALDKEEAAFNAAHTDFNSLKPKFVEWARTQPDSIQQIAQRNGQGIVDAAEAIRLVDLFKADTGIPKTPAAATPKPAPAAPTKLQERREAQLAAAKSTPAQKGPEISGSPSDEEALFKLYAARKEKKAS